jgi:hypothetical protein
MPRRRTHIAPVLLTILLAGCSAEIPPHVQSASERIPDRVSFSLDVRPILSERCFCCHGPDAEGRVTKLRFDTE